MMRITNTTLKSFNKNRVTAADGIPGEIVVSSHNYMDLITECDRLTRQGWKVQYEYSKLQYMILGKRKYYVKLKKWRDGLDT